MSVKGNGGMKLRGETPRTRRKTCPSATLSAPDLTRTDPSANPGIRGENLATNRFSHKPLVAMVDPWAKTVHADISSATYWTAVVATVSACRQWNVPCLILLSPRWCSG
jgi:hypothetical protein